jgi:hypothetical protein
VRFYHGQREHQHFEVVTTWVTINAYDKMMIVNQKPEYSNDYKDPKEEIMKVYYHIAIAALNTEVSFHRRKNSTTTMIEKLPGCPRINKL